MTQWHMIIDVEKCEDCNNCFLACKDEHVDNDWPGITLSQPRHGHRWMNILRKERGQYPLIDVAYRPTPCMHCHQPPCARAAKNNAVIQRPDGIVLIDPDRSKGQKELVNACPYGAIWWNEALELPQKCTFCAHLLESGWRQPRCVQACPTGALQVVRKTSAQMDAIVEARSLEVLNPGLGARPRVYYQNLYRFTSCFISGSVAIEQNGMVECMQGATVILSKDGDQIDGMSTDAFGDFKFDRLKENSGVYQLEIQLPGKPAKELKVSVEQSVSLGTVMLN